MALSVLGGLVTLSTEPLEVVIPGILNLQTNIDLGFLLSGDTIGSSQSGGLDLGGLLGGGAGGLLGGLLGGGGGGGPLSDPLGGTVGSLLDMAGTLVSLPDLT